MQVLHHLLSLAAARSSPGVFAALAQLPPVQSNTRCKVENELLKVTLQGYHSRSCSLLWALVLIYIIRLMKLKALVATFREVSAACMCPAGPWQAGPGLGPDQSSCCLVQPFGLWDPVAEMILPEPLWQGGVSSPKAGCEFAGYDQALCLICNVREQPYKIPAWCQLCHIFKGVPGRVSTL